MSSKCYRFHAFLDLVSRSAGLNHKDYMLYSSLHATKWSIECSFLGKGYESMDLGSRFQGLGGQ